MGFDTGGVVEPFGVVLWDEHNCGGPGMSHEVAHNTTTIPVIPWPSPVIPLIISSVYNNDSRESIEVGIRLLELYTCVKFVKPKIRRFQVMEPYVMVSNGKGGCNARAGFDHTPGFISYVHLHSPECIRRVGHVIHELMHVLGFYHEHQRQDRDEHIRVIYENILPDHEFNFRKMYDETFGLPYDVASVMHYGTRGFCKNCSRDTIEALPGERNAHMMGQRLNLSRTDVARVNRLYDCGEMYLGDDLPGAVPYRIWRMNQKRDVVGFANRYLQLSP
ncbi:low choriolytic enzyme-like [Cherax quadricarinatus]|uniref:low choriolytic enzyme-like n=1 Tax=Cherax quadricarinatus TaxID=27406 RepID=UPI00387EDE12